MFVTLTVYTVVSVRLQLLPFTKIVHENKTSVRKRGYSSRHQGEVWLELGMLGVIVQPLVLGAGKGAVSGSSPAEGGGTG